MHSRAQCVELVKHFYVYMFWCARVPCEKLCKCYYACRINLCAVNSAFCAYARGHFRAARASLIWTFIKYIWFICRGSFTTIFIWRISQKHCLILLLEIAGVKGYNFDTDRCAMKCSTIRVGNLLRFYCVMRVCTRKRGASKKKFSWIKQFDIVLIDINNNYNSLIIYKVNIKYLFFKKDINKFGSSNSYTSIVSHFVYTHS